MGDKPQFRIVKGPWNPETKKWALDAGAAWSRDGKEGYSIQITMPDGSKEKYLMIPTYNKPIAKSAQVSSGRVNKPDLDDSIPF